MRSNSWFVILGVVLAGCAKGGGDTSTASATEAGTAESASSATTSAATSSTPPTAASAAPTPAPTATAPHDGNYRVGDRVSFLRAAEDGGPQPGTVIEVQGDRLKIRLDFWKDDPFFDKVVDKTQVTPLGAADAPPVVAGQPAPEPVATAAPPASSPACEEYARAASCLLAKLPAAQRASLQATFDQALEQIKNLGGGADAACRQELETQRPALAQVGCLGGSEGPPAVVGTTSSGGACGAASSVPDIPGGRSNPPTLEEWGASGCDVNTQGAGSHARDCTMKVLREWLQVTCRGDVLGHEQMDGFGSNGLDYFEHFQPGSIGSFVVRLRPGISQKVRICRNGDRASLFVSWPPSNQKPTIIALAQGPACDGSNWGSGSRTPSPAGRRCEDVGCLGGYQYGFCSNGECPSGYACAPNGMCTCRQRCSE